MTTTALRAAIAALECGEPSAAPLEALGDPEPARSAEALARAANAPDLASTRLDWLPELLLTARPGFGAAVLCDLADRYRQACGRALDLRAHPSLVRVLGSSDFLARLLLRHPNWVEELAGDPPPPPRGDAIEADWTAIRVAKYRALLRIAARDLAGRSFEDSSRELSDLADSVLDAALRTAAPGAAGEPPTLLALGKLGGRELNFSSDVDLLFIYADEGDEDPERNRGVARVVQELKRQLESASDDGFGYRVDLDLRPEGRTGAIANSVSAALHYYETFGAEWERQALVRLRPVAGPRRVADEFIAGTTHFVYRRLIDPSAIRRVREMKTRIEDERRRTGHDLEQDLKEGPGGIRDVEFLVQALQLFWGGRFPELRTGNVLDALAALRRARLLPEPVIAGLVDAYTWLRRAEHALQLVEERQTARFPRDARAQIALARRLRYREPQAARARDQLLDDWTNQRAFVRRQFEALVLEAGPE